MQDDDPKRSLEEIEADIAAMGFGFADEEEKKAHHLRCDALFYGKVCGVCGKELGSAVWRDRIATGHDWSPWHRQKYWMCPSAESARQRMRGASVTHGLMNLSPALAVGAPFTIDGIGRGDTRSAPTHVNLRHAPYALAI